MNVPIKPEQLHEFVHRIQGKTVVVAGLHGASHGVGVEVAHLYAEKGANVVLADVDAHALAGAVHAVKAAGGHAVHKVTDVRRPEQVEELFKFAAETYGPVDVVVNVAGLGGEITAELTETQKSDLSDPTILGVHHVTRTGLNWLLQNPGTDLKSLVTINTPGIDNVKVKVVPIVRPLVALYEGKGIKMGTVFPWFHDLADFSPEIKEMIGHVESPPLSQVALASLYLATDPEHNGCILILTELAATDMVEYGAIAHMKAEFIEEMKAERSGEAADKPPSPWMKFLSPDAGDSDGPQPEMPPIMAKFLQKKSNGDGVGSRPHRGSISGDKGGFRSEMESIKKEISGGEGSNVEKSGAETGLKKRSPNNLDREDFTREFGQIKKEIAQGKAERKGEQPEEESAGECSYLAKLSPEEAAAARARVVEGHEQVSGDADQCPHLIATGQIARPEGGPGAHSKRAPRPRPGAGDSSESDSEAPKKSPAPPSFGGGGKPGFGRGKPKSDSESEGGEEPKKSGFAKFGGGGKPSFGGKSKPAESGDESESEAPKKSGFAKFGGGGGKPSFGGRSKPAESGEESESEAPKKSGFAKFGGGGGKPGFGGRSKQGSDSEGEASSDEKQSKFGKFGGSGGKPGFGGRSKKGSESEGEAAPAAEKQSKFAKFGGGGKPGFGGRSKKPAESDEEDKPAAEGKKSRFSGGGGDGEKKSGFAKFGGGGGKPGFGGKSKGDEASSEPAPEGRKSNFAKFNGAGNRKIPQLPGKNDAKL